MKLKLHRKYLKENYTIGHLYEMVNGVERFICDVIEDKVRDLPHETKVYGETAIPYGTYEVLLTVSPKFRNHVWAQPYNGVVPLLKDVHGFDGVRIHCGNTERDSLGCLIVGRNTQKGKVTHSQKTFHTLMREYLLPAKNRGEKIEITIV